MYDEDGEDSECHDLEDLYFPELLKVLQKQSQLKELSLKYSKFNDHQTERLLKTITEA